MSPHRSSSRERPPAPAPLPLPVVDNHVHLDFARDGESPVPVEEALRAAVDVGVTRLVQIGCDLDSARFTVRAVDEHPELLGGVALHPNEIPGLASSGALAEAEAEIETLAAHPRVRVIGETGLDYFRTGPEGIPAQQEAFRWHIDLAKRTGKALQVHDRDAHDDVLRILDEEGAPQHTVLHCFSGDQAMARAAVDRGLMLSFAGTVTFKSATSPAQRAGRDAAGAPAGGDRRAVPHPDAVPWRPQRLLSRARSRCARWPGCSAWTCRRCAGR